MDVPRQELAGYVKTAAIAATAFDAEDMGALAENLGRINKNFKLSAEQGRELADVINYLDDNSLSKGAELIEYMNRVSGSMGLAKISDKNTAALGSTLLSSGVDESTAANAVSSLFTRLSTAPDMKPVREALKGLGMDAKAVQKGMVTDANATVMKIIEAVKKMPKEKQAGFLKGLAGGEYNKVFATLVSNTEEWRRQLELANSEAAKGSMAREFETRAGAMSSKWQEFKNQLFNTGAELGMTLMPAINELLDKKIKTLRHLYDSEKRAWNGARAAFRRLQRGAAQFSIRLAAGRPDMSPETPVSVKGFKPEIDGEKWLVTEVSHRLDSGGYVCSLNLEALPDLEGG